MAEPDKPKVVVVVQPASAPVAAPDPIEAEPEPDAPESVGAAAPKAPEPVGAAEPESVGATASKAPLQLQGPWSGVTMTAVALCLLGLVGALLAGAVRPQAQNLADVGAQVKPGRAHTWLSELQRDYPDRWRGSVENRNAPQFIAKSLKEAGAYSVRHEFFEDLELINVLARIPGRDPTRCVVVAAHHDVVVGAPGAIDDGGAVAAIIEATRAIIASGQKPACDIEIIIFDGEEIEGGSGIRGSTAHLLAADPAGRDRVKATLAVELVGWTEDQLVVHTIPYGFQWDAEGIAPAWVPEAVRAGGHEVGVEVGLGDPYLSLWYQGLVRVQKVNTGSDAGAYAANGIPSAMLTGSALTNFYNGYHQPSDGMGKVSSERLDDAARVVAATALELSARAVQDPPRKLGQRYLMVGRRTLGRPALTALGAGAALALLLAAIGLSRIGQRAVAILAAIAAVGMAGVAITADVMGTFIGVPLCLGIAAGSFQRGGWVVMFASRVPLYLQVGVFMAASGVFGFAWRGETAPAVLTAIVAVAGVLAGMRLTQARK